MFALVALIQFYVIKNGLSVKCVRRCFHFIKSMLLKGSLIFLPISFVSSLNVLFLNHLIIAASYCKYTVHGRYGRNTKITA